MDELRHVPATNKKMVRASLREVSNRFRALIRSHEAEAVVMFVWVKPKGKPGMLREMVSCTAEDFREIAVQLPDVMARLAAHIGVTVEKAKGTIAGSA